MDVSAVLLLEMLALTALTSFLFIEFVTPISVWAGLVDKPNTVRKHHVGDVPLAGGIAVFISTLIGCFIWLGAELVAIKIFLLASTVVVFIGVLDDKYELSVRARLVGQIVISLLLVVGAQTNLSRLGDLFGLGSIYLGPEFSFLLTAFSVVAVINAFNMLDGMDGLLGCVSIVPLMSVGFLMFNSGSNTLASLAMIMSAAIVPFLIYNIGVGGKKFSKIFLGDAGSMFLGLGVLFLMISGSQGTAPSFRPVTALWLTAIPLMDLATVTARRIYNKTPIFSADKEHLHHVLRRAGFSDFQILFAVVIISMIFAVVGIWGEFREVSESVMFFSFIGCFTCYFGLLHGRFRNQKFPFLLAEALSHRKAKQLG